MFQSVELKQHPELKRVVVAAFPSYKKHSAYLSEFSPTTINTYWDGGSRDVYVVVELATGKHHALPTSSHPWFDLRGITAESPDVEVERGVVTLKRLPEGFALVRGGVFCGKLATAHVLVNSANLTKLLPQ
jgi:hypothetical protein